MLVKHNKNLSLRLESDRENIPKHPKKMATLRRTNCHQRTTASIRGGEGMIFVLDEANGLYVSSSEAELTSTPSKAPCCSRVRARGEDAARRGLWP